LASYSAEGAKRRPDDFHLFGFSFVVSFIAPDNERSIKVAHRIGMELEEILQPEANKWNRTVHVYAGS
jgi:RimJ/RimL family protein N-acetyltransferase